jgi:hypothetical protein
MSWLWSLMACGPAEDTQIALPAPAPAPAPGPSPAEPAQPAPAEVPVAPSVTMELGPELVGLCDASAGVRIDRFLVVADDERNQLRVYDWAAGGTPAPAIDLASLSPLFTGKDEADLEGMALLPDGTVWLTSSHDSGKGTERQPSRQRLFALSLQVAPDGSGLQAKLAHGPTAELIEKGQYTKPMYDILVNTVGKTSKDPLGLSIEGLAAGPAGSLLVGFRAPVHAGKALIQRLEDPAAFAGGGEPRFTGPRWLVLGGGGIRSLEADGSGGYLVVSGPSDEDGEFSLWRWRGFDDGSAPVRVPVELGTLRPEGLLRMDDAWWLLSDDGTLKLGGERCKDLPSEQRRARTARLVGLE